MSVSHPSPRSLPRPYRLLLVAISLLFSFSSIAETASDYGVAPWTEALVSVADLDQSTSWLIEHGHWRTVASGEMQRAELDYWALPQSVHASFRRLCAPLADTGCIRFVRFDGAEGLRPIRLAARPWDTGGIFSIMLRTDDAQAAFDSAIAMGWWAESQPYAFSFGGVDLINVVIRGPHGINYALYERREPPFSGFPVGSLSQAFNSMRMVRNQPASLDWYRNQLGFELLFDAPYTDDEERPNNFSIPPNLAVSIVRRAAVVQPVLPGEVGRIELMQFEGFTGRDFSTYASPPNFGIISVRYPVRDLVGYRAMLSSRDVRIVHAAERVQVGGIGVIDLLAVRDPDGALTEFYEARLPGTQ